MDAEAITHARGPLQLRQDAIDHHDDEIARPKGRYCIIRGFRGVIIISGMIRPDTEDVLRDQLRLRDGLEEHFGSRSENNAQL